MFLRLSSALRMAALASALLLSGQAQAGELTVSAAASLTNAMRELASLYEAKRPDTKVLLNFGASGSLLQQIAKGAPVDVFASADQQTMDKAQEQNLIRADWRRDFASNALVVIVPASRGTVPASLEDLAQGPYQRIALGQPASVPVGRYAKATLEEGGVWPAIEPRVIGAQSVRQVLDYVARDEVDAGFVYATDAAIMPDKVTVAFVLPSKILILYPIAPIANSRSASASASAVAATATAEDFVAFVGSEQAQAVLAKFGFGKP